MIAMPSLAEDKGTVQQMLIACQSYSKMLRKAPANRDDYYNFGLCVGRMEGFGAGVLHVAAHPKYPGRADKSVKEIVTFYGVCPSPGVDMKQQIAVFVKWAENNPEKWNRPFAYGIYTSWSEAWPCSK